MTEREIVDRLETLEWQTKELAQAISEMMAPEVARDLLGRFGFLSEQQPTPLPPEEVIGERWSGRKIDCWNLRTDGEKK